MIEAIDVLSETAWAELPPAAIERLGIGPGQKNLLVRVVLRAPAAQHGPLRSS